MEKWLKALQSLRKIPQGKAKFQEIDLIVTDCIHDNTDSSSALTNLMQLSNQFMRYGN
jgi:hypothetical protein